MPEQKMAVIGHPIGHSMSLFLHERLSALSGVPMSYRLLDVPDLTAALPELKELDGFNVTIPHKSAVIPFLDEVDGRSAACGSVNTVKCENGRLIGTTTDGAGCIKALERHGLDVSGHVLLLGNGGAARALAFEIVSRQERVRLTIACRRSSYPKAMALGDDLGAYLRRMGKRGFRIVVESYEELEAAARYPDPEFGFRLLINATSVGMYPNVGKSPVSQAVLLACGAAFDAVYNPEETELLRLAKEAGVKAVGGMEMLVYQAAAAHEFWFGTRFLDENIARLCEDARREMNEKFGKQGRE